MSFLLLIKNNKVFSPFAVSLNGYSLIEDSETGD